MWSKQIYLNNYNDDHRLSRISYASAYISDHPLSTLFLFLFSCYLSPVAAIDCYLSSLCVPAYSFIIFSVPTKFGDKICVFIYNALIFQADINLVKWKSQTLGSFHLQNNHPLCSWLVCNELLHFIWNIFVVKMILESSDCI